MLAPYYGTIPNYLCIRKKKGNNQLNHNIMKEFPTCRFLTTAFSMTEKDITPEELQQQTKEFLQIAQGFLTNESIFIVYDTSDTLLNDLDRAAHRKKKGLS